MSYLTRRERDAAIMLATAFAASFMAGVFSYQTIGGTVVYAYDVGLGLLMLAALLFLAYRALRRAAVAAHRLINDARGAA